jgi:serine protease AprX
MAVLSCVAGRIEGIQIGLAIDAEFLLARTETWTEFFSEEEQWLAAAEWADKNGAHIINSSLGYTYHRYFPEQMNGKKSLVSRAANMAARKGILVVNSAGNEGDGKWKIIGTPADADSVLSIGGISPWTGFHTGFSSFGPTSDKRMKPNVTAYGHVIGAGPGGLSQTQGTSFSGPLTAGFAACAKQARPNMTNMQLFKEIEKSADLYPYFDYAHGYGVPQASYFFRKNTMEEKPERLVEIEDANGKLNIKILDVVQFSLNEDSDTSLREASNEAIETEIVEDESKTEDTYYLKWPDYVFYHIENSKGYLDKYWVVDPQPNYSYIFKNLGNSTKAEANVSPLIINKADFAKPFTLRVFYKGQISTYTVN